MSSEEIEKLLYENRVLKLELQKLKSKSDFFIESKIFDGINNNTEITGKITADYNKDKINENKIDTNQNNGDFLALATSIRENAENINITPSNNSLNNIIGNASSKTNKNINDRNLNNNENSSIKSSALNSYGNLNYNSEINMQNNNMNEYINSLILNNNTDLISENSSKKNQLSYKETLDNNFSNKKSSAYNSLFKAGESLISGPFSSLNNSLAADKRNRSPDNIALKKVNDRIKFLESLEKESTKMLNKQREKIKNEKIKKEEENKKKIDHVNFYLFLFF